MKKTLITLITVVAAMTLAQAQDKARNFDFVFSAGIDPKMAAVGPHKEAPDNSSSLDVEFSAGFEWSNTRLLMQLKSHEAVNFLKWTYLQFDYKQETIKNLYLYGGLEISQIKIHHPDYSYDQPDNYREHTINPMQLGINLELQYKFFNDRAGVAVQFGMYQSEDELKPFKKYRKDVTTTLFFYL